MVKIEYNYTPEDYVELTTLAQRAPKVRRRVLGVRLLTAALIFSYCFFLYGIFGKTMLQSGDSVGIIFNIIMVATIAAGILMGLRRSKKSLRDNVLRVSDQGRLPPGFFGPRTLAVEETGVTISYAEQSLVLPYYDLEGVAEYNGGLALCKGGALWDLIPASAFQSESDRAALTVELEHRKSEATVRTKPLDFPQPQQDAQLVLHFSWTAEELECFDAAVRREDTRTWRFWKSQLWLTLFSLLTVVGIIASVRIALAGEAQSLFYMVLRPIVFLACNVRLIVAWTPLNRLFSRRKCGMGMFERILAGPTTVSFTQKGFHSTTSLGNDFVTWGQVKGAHRAAGGLVILTYKYMRYPIPASAFSTAEQVDEVKTMIQKYVGQRWVIGA